MRNFTIYYSDLSDEAKENILVSIKEDIREELKEEAIKIAPDKTFKQFMIDNYSIGENWETKEDLDKYFTMDLEEFIEETATDRINRNWACQAEI